MPRRARTSPARPRRWCPSAAARGVSTACWASPSNWCRWTDPLAYRPAQPFQVKLLLAGQPLGGVRVAALPQTKPETMVHGRTGRDGVARLVLPHGGLWTLYAVRIEPAARPLADWESSWTSLTMRIAEAGR